MGLWLSGGGLLRRFDSRTCVQADCVPLAGAGVLCVRSQTLYCAAEGDMLWRLDARSLQPRALFAGGPGMCGLLPSADGRRLYALSGGADSVLLLSAADGAPQALARAGCNPPDMALDDETGLLAVAGGRRESVLLLHAHTLGKARELPMPGPVYGVAFAGKGLWALCRTGERRSALAVWRSGRNAVFRLSGAPGTLLARAWGVLAATQEGLFACTEAACTPLRKLTGLPSRLALLQGRLVWLDLFREAAMSLDAAGGRPELLCAPAAGLAAYTLPDGGKPERNGWE